MNFADEHYVRLYTRDTKTMKRWGWEGRALFCELIRKLDKAGVLDEIDDPVADVALMTEIPEEVVERALPRLLKSGTVEIVSGCLVMPNYIEANSVARSDKIRAKESRQRRVAEARLADLKGEETVTNRDAGVTERTEPNAGERERTKSNDVTERDGAITNRERGDTNRSKTSQPRSSASPNARQRSTEGSKDPTPHPRPTGQSSADSGGRGRNLESVLGTPIRDRARQLLERPHEAQWLEPHRWPEVLELAESLKPALGVSRVTFSRFERDSGLRRLVEAFEVFTVEELREFAKRAQSDSWFQGKGFSCLSAEVIRKRLGGAPAKETKPQSVEDAVFDRNMADKARELGIG